LLESMACGLPVISTRVGIAPEVIVDKVNGFLVDIDDAATILEKIEFLSKDSLLTKQIGERARKTVVEKWQWKHTTKNLLELYLVAKKNFINRQTPQAIAIKDYYPNKISDESIMKWTRPREYSSFAVSLKSQGAYSAAMKMLFKSFITSSLDMQILKRNGIIGLSVIAGILGLRK